MVLTAEQQSALRARLEAERGRLRGDLAELGTEVAVLGQSQQLEGGSPGNHFADDATDIVEQEKDLALIEGLRGRLYDIERAIERMDRGAYGRCERCGQPIAPERLEALPSARLCITCKAREARSGR
ncbi:MAG TPA: TraR/DksA C4-type zinc finger protein [Thermomicrobiales bacterium]|nr:TraR/DksA C4-type zinc finger protein [Thermomicrobiales bacterium]